MGMQLTKVKENINDIKLLPQTNQTTE